LNKTEDDQRCFIQFCNILKWSAIVQGKLLKGCLESTVSYASIRIQVQWVSKVLRIRNGRRPPKVWGPRFQPVQPKDKSGTAHNWDYLKLSMNIECNLIWHVVTADTCPLQFPRSVLFACSWSSNFLFALSIQVIFKRVALKIKILFRDYVW
jgi:hypothetical protein